MISEISVLGDEGQVFHLPKLDRLTEGNPSFSIKGGRVTYGSEAFAVEEHVDNYLTTLFPLLYAVGELCGPDRAMELVLTRRNQTRGRDRVAAAAELAAMVPNLSRLKKVLNGGGYFLDYDAAEFGFAWVWKSKTANFTGVIVGVMADGNGVDVAVVGSGDGYHRASGFDPEIPYDSEGNGENCARLDDPAAILSLVEEVHQEVEAESGPDRCDEKYWRDYCRVRKLLKKKAKSGRR